jgi:hypothetical protein
LFSVLNFLIYSKCWDSKTKEKVWQQNNEKQQQVAKSL